jgi:hypothetical protein
MLKCKDQVMCGCNGSIGGGSSRHVNLGGEPREGVGDAFGLGTFNPHPKTPIVIRSGANVPPINCMGCPRFPDRRLFVD